MKRKQITSSKYQANLKPILLWTGEEFYATFMNRDSSTCISCFDLLGEMISHNKCNVLKETLYG